MFSGIVETNAKLLKSTPMDQSLQIEVAKPSEFNDLSVGDSIAVNGICLTVEDATDAIVFTLGFETLNVLGKIWAEGEILNLERSLRFGDRVHGHFVTGHVDTMGEIVDKTQQGECLLLQIRVNQKFSKYFWPKGSVALNGVSLTINEFSENKIGVCLIPETLRRTNLAGGSVGDRVTVEVDSMARAFLSKGGPRELHT